MATATLTSKGQITIPKQIRDLLHLEAGDKVDFLLEDDVNVVLRPATVDVTELDGLLHDADGPSASIDEMNEFIETEGAGLND